MIYTLLGIAIIAAIYLYLMASQPTPGEREAKKQAKQAEVADDEPVSKTVRLPQDKPKRFCPICQSEMGPYEKLYGEIYRAQPRDKVLIKGCRHCYAIPAKPGTQPDFEGALNL